MKYPNMPKQKLKYENWYQYPMSIMLNVTDDCNLACRYCFVEQQPHYMSLETAKKAVDWVYANYLYRKHIGIVKPTDKVDVYFFGGEPMLMFNKIIKPLVGYIEKRYDINLFQLGITTNCTLLNKERIDFLYQYKFGILPSIDGAEETQCYNRPCKNGQNSSKLVEQNIPYLLEKFPNLMFRSTIYAPTVHLLFKNFLYAERMGFKSYIAIPDERTQKWTKKQKKILEEQVTKIFTYNLQKRLRNEPTTDISPMIRDTTDMIYYLQNNKYPLDSVLTCGLGIKCCAIGWDGKIYGCQQEVSLKKKNLFYIGDLNNGINIKQHKRLLNKYTKEMWTQPRGKKCNKCVLQKMCSTISGTHCAATDNLLNHNTHKFTDIRCYFRQIMFKQTLAYYSFLNQK